jgi:hypothetical protein
MINNTKATVAVARGLEAAAMSQLAGNGNGLHRKSIDLWTGRRAKG